MSGNSARASSMEGRVEGEETVNSGVLVVMQGMGRIKTTSSYTSNYT